jgi:hypothetical protein
MLTGYSRFRDVSLAFIKPAAAISDFMHLNLLRESMENIPLGERI